MENNKDLSKIRHSCAHLLAAAILELYPGSKLAIGPSIENGFYYDIDFSKPISEDDLEQIERKMKDLLSSWISFDARSVSKDEALAIFNENPYKKELIEEIVSKGEEITLFKSGNFEDLCRGGHTQNPSQEIGAFKLLSLAGAYWRGNEKNKMLTRIYGTCFPTQKELDDYLTTLEETKKRDHKKLGKELELFTFSETVGKGLPLWTPKGATIRRILERYIVDEELKRGYLHVYTPDIAQIGLYEKSGHYPYYKDSMYAPIDIEGEKFMLRPMTCPHHFELYLSQPRSYRDLPIRYAELAKLYRFEKSGELSGLQRVRTFTLADAHIVTPKQQAEDEIHEVLELIDSVANTLGLKKHENYWYRLSLGDRLDEIKYYKDDASWDMAENALRNVLIKRNEKFVEAQNEAAFYGPKIDIQMRNVNGKEDTAFTVQYDFVMPKRFKLEYVTEDGSVAEPVVIHRSSIGAIERIIAFLIEHYGGKFPVWLAPVQAVIIPISDKQNEFAEEVYKSMHEKGVRAELDKSSETMQSKIRKATLQKVPFMCIIGGKEVDTSRSSGKYYFAVRSCDGKNLGSMDLDAFADQINEKIEKKLQ